MQLQSYISQNTSQIGENLTIDYIDYTQNAHHKGEKKIITSRMVSNSASSNGGAMYPKNNQQFYK